MTKTTISLVPTLLLTSAFGIGVLAGACKSTEANPDHCSLNEGDRYCAEISPDRPVCSNGYSGMCNTDTNTGCVAEEDLAPGCSDPCGTLSSEECEGVADGSSTGGSGSSGPETDGPMTTTGDTDSSGSESTTTGPVPCMGNEECTSPAAPVCGDEGVCVPCDQGPVPAEGDAACAAAEPTTPVCLEGSCVTCTAAKPEACTDQLLLCDEASNECVPCTEHEQCESGACEIAEGRCFPPGIPVVTVDGDLGSGADHPSITSALTAIGAGNAGVIVLHELDMDASYQGSTLTISSGQIAILAAQGENPVILGTGGSAGLTVSGAGTVVYLDGIDMAGNTNGQGLSVNGAFTWVDRGRIVQNSGGGVLASNSADVTLRNCFVGGDDNFVPAIEVTDSSLDLLYSTAVGGFAGATSLLCDNPIAVNVRNSILLVGDPGSGVSCDATITTSATEVEVGDFNGTQMWFSNYVQGNFSLATAGENIFVDRATWRDGDPTTDIDGTLRPTVDGTPDYAGADVP